ncbi:TonB-dependent siderophore receptor [Acinetobacter larvae]|uniref:Ligand-gated channel protein n=1 Tax=Acinetobacter larvae TaxID=1789224 RepID=A0A1B2M1G0_9GAMM|nr:TonB-dependent receptor [Acinetobacter larvae]AOA58853.1 ligand-gated channel protein [Acinetobacter larvae]
MSFTRYQVLTLAVMASLQQVAFAQTQHYQIAVAPLAQTMAKIARQNKVSLSADPALLEGKIAPAIEGDYALDHAFDLALHGSGLVLIKNADGSMYSLKLLEKKPSTPADDIVILETIQLQAKADQTAQQVEMEKGAVAELPVISLHAEDKRLASAKISIMKGANSIKEIPQSVSVMTRQQMDEQGISDLRDAANHVTGVVGTKGVGQGMILSARGFQIDAWQYDGIPIPRNMYALGNWGTQDMVFYENLEVLRGASGLMQGTGSPGGAVNLVRKRGSTHRNIALTARAGSWDRYGAQLDAGGPLNQDASLRGRIVFDEADTHSFVDYVHNRTHSLYAALDYDLGPATTLGVGVSYSDSQGRPMIRGLPRYSDGGDLGLSRSTYSGAWWNRANIQQTMLYADFEHHFNQDWRFKVSILNLNEKNTSVHQRIQGAVANDGSGITYANWATDFDSSKIGMDTYLTGDFQFLGRENKLTVGATYSKYTSDDMYARTFTPEGNVFAIEHHRPWQNVDTIMAAGGVQTLADYDVQQKGVYASWHIKPLNSLTAIVGARGSWYEYIYNESLYNTQTVNKASGEITPYVGLIYDINPEWSVYGSFTSVFEPQSSRDIHGRVLDPIIGSNYELGIKGALMDEKVNASLAIFRYDHKNRPVNDVESGFACDGWYCSKPSGEVRSEGIEAELNGEILPNLQLLAGYTFNKTEFLSDPVNQGKVFSTWTPKHMLRTWASYQLPGQWNQLTLSGGFSTQTHTLSYDRSFKVPGFTVWNMRLSYQLTPDSTIAMNFNNIFDKRYWISAFAEQNGNNDYGDPRNVMFTLHSKF